MTSFNSFLFIVTYGRSGSTLLQTILNSISGYFIAGENENALFGLYTSYRAVCFAKETYGRNETKSNHPWYRADALDPQSYGQKLAHLFISEVIRPDENARVVGFKEIRFFIHPPFFEKFLQFIEIFFNPAKLIFNVRDPSEVAKSAWWNDQDTPSVTEKIQGYHAMVDEYISKYPGNSFKLNYNEYQRDLGHLRELFEFLGEPFDEDAIKRIMAVKLTH